MTEASELAGFAESILRQLVMVEVHTDHIPFAQNEEASCLQPTPAEELKQRNERRDAERSKRGWTPEQIERGSRYIHPKTRPSDGMPVGSKEFDYEEYETRKRDRLAADPARAAERKARIKARQERAAEPYVKVWLQRQVDAANADIASLGISNRLRDIWTSIIIAEQSKRIEDMRLDQSARIANRKNLERCEGRVRGLGAAARRAGF